MAASSDDNVYYKRGRKYIPFGLRYGQNYLPDGIWYVRHFDHSYGHTNVDHYLSGMYRVGDIPEYVDIPKLCSTHSYVEYILASKEFKEIMDNHSYTFQELVAKITALVLDLNNKIKSKENDDSKRPKGYSNSF